MIPVQFDYVFFMGVFYHLRYPLFALDKLCTKVGGRLVFAGCAALAVLGAWLVSAWPLVAALCWGTAAVLANSPWRVRAARHRRTPALAARTRSIAWFSQKSVPHAH